MSQHTSPVSSTWFTEHTIESAPPASRRSFLASGYTTQNALEVVLGIGAYTLSTLANRLTDAPVDEQVAAFG